MRVAKRWVLAAGGLAVLLGWAGTRVAGRLWPAAARPPSLRGPAAAETAGATPLRADLVRTAGEVRVVEGRLTGGFAPAPLDRAGALGDPRYRRAVGAAARRPAPADDETAAPAAQADRGVALLLAGEPRAAVERLAEAVRRAPGDAAAASDYAAALLERAEAEQAPHLAVRALDAAERALRVDPGLPEARFNRALALAKLHLGDAARAAWDDYLAADPGSGWAEEARRRRDELPPPVAGAWEEARRALEAGGFADPAAVGRAVAGFPSAARIEAEEALLPAWGEAVGRDGPAAGGDPLARARALGRAIAERSANRSVADAVAAIDAASSRADGVRLAALAAGHAAYGRGKADYEAADYDRARGELTAAEADLDRGGSPFAAVAALILAGCDYYQSDFARAGERLDDLERRLAANERLPMVAGSAAWVRGVMAYVGGRPIAALAHYETAQERFARAGEPEYVAAVHNLKALALEYVGESAAAWQERAQGFAALDTVVTPRRRYLLLSDGARAAFAQEMPGAARTLEDGAIAAAESWGNGVAVAESFWWRSRIAAALGDGAAAARDLDEAESRRAEIADEATRRRLAGDLALVRGERLAAADPAAAVALLDEALARHGAESEDLRPELLLARAGARRRLGDREGAAADLAALLAFYERRRLAIGDADYRISYFDEARPAFEAALALAAEGGAPKASWAIAERARARGLLDLASGVQLRSQGLAGERRPPSPALAEVQGDLPAGVAVVEYAVLPEEVLLWVLRRDRLAMERLALPAADLAARVREFRAAIDRRSAAAADRLAEGLHAALAAPALRHADPGDLLVIVPDRELHLVPFAALRDPATGRRLIEDHALEVAPSAAVYVRAAERARELRAAGPAGGALVVGDPALGAAELSRYGPLPGAAREAAEVARLYGVAPVEGEAATVARFVEAAPAAGLIHFAGHGVVNLEAPLWSRLLLAPEPAAAGEAARRGNLYAGEIYRLRLPATRLVVLASCSTAEGFIWGNEGVASLARAFLAAGVPQVLSSLWPAEDRATARLLLSFHRRLLAGDEPAAALRAAQLAALAAGGGPEGEPASWAGFQLVGGGPPD